MAAIEEYGHYRRILSALTFIDHGLYGKGVSRLHHTHCLILYRKGGREGGREGGRKR